MRYKRKRRERWHNNFITPEWKTRVAIFKDEK